MKSWVELPAAGSRVVMIVFGYISQMTFKVVVKISVISNSVKLRKKKEAY